MGLSAQSALILSVGGDSGHYLESIFSRFNYLQVRVDSFMRSYVSTSDFLFLSKKSEISIFSSSAPVFAAKLNRPTNFGRISFDLNSIVVWEFLVIRYRIPSISTNFSPT